MLIFRIGPRCFTEFFLPRFTTNLDMLNILDFSIGPRFVTKQIGPGVTAILGLDTKYGFSFDK